jgi:parallel beta-helix repeat protein
MRIKMMRTKAFGLTCFFLVTLILISISETGMASEFHVRAGESIQDTIDEASSGDIILVDPGEFKESICVNKENLTIKSASGNPDNTHIIGETAGSYVFEIVATNVEVSGFSITNGRCGIFINRAGNCTISDNKISNQNVGIYLFDSGNNLLNNNMVYSNLECGIKLLTSSNNIICGNYFNNTDNARDNKINIWNDRIGNYWSDYNGTDENGDGIGDTPYVVNSKTGGMDQKPLMEYILTPQTLPKAHFTSNVTEGFAPLSVVFKEFSENATSWLWDFGDGDNSSSSNPLHTFIGEGDYVVSLTVSNENGSDSASVTINVLNASEQSGPILPKAEFVSNTTGGHVPLVIKFVDISKNADCITWTFGDGKTSCCPEPAHTFYCPGNYTVSLTAENENGTSSANIFIAVESNGTDTDAKKPGDSEVTSSTENTEGLVSYIVRSVSNTSNENSYDTIIDAINAGATEKTDSKSENISKGTEKVRIIYREKLESMKDSIVSTASSKILSEKGLSLENETLKVQKDVEAFVDDSVPGAGDSLPDAKKRIAPWIPSFLGLAGVVFIAFLLKKRRRTRK